MGRSEHCTTDGANTPAAQTESTAREAERPSVRRFQLQLIEGPGAGVVWTSLAAGCSVGSHGSSDLVIDDPTVSRFHCEIRVERLGARIRDLESTNGTMVDGVTVVEAFLRGGSQIRLGRSAMRFQFDVGHNPQPVSERTAFGTLVGESPTMRMTFALLERAARSNATVLIEGETGTGKEGAAASIHRESARRDQPFVVVDCSAIPEQLLESELFGHERGAFTGAVGRRVGAFEEASRGTLFLDEVGELSLELQPKLLRALEQREIRRIGSNGYVPVDVRVVAATNRDLRREVNAGRFRSDLYYRLAVLRIPMPALRHRPADIPRLTTHLLHGLGASAEQAERLRRPELLAMLGKMAWPGNVRELRNYLERCLVFDELPPCHEPLAETPVDGELPLVYEDARRRALDHFEQRYLLRLLRRHQGKVALAAREAGVDRVYIYRLMRKHQLKG